VRVNTTSQQTVVMKPGELIEWSDKVANLKPKPVKPENYEAWTNKQLIFEHTPLTEVAALIQDNFGRRINIRNPKLLEKSLTGTISLENEAILLQALESIYGVKMHKEGDVTIWE
jgi:transmembrane sensor